MRLIVLGGPKFLGRAVADAALAPGRELTFYNRGRTNPRLYREVERLIGDRDGDLSTLQGRRWDAVIDTCGYVPHVIHAAAEALSGPPTDAAGLDPERESALLAACHAR